LMRRFLKNDKGSAIVEVAIMFPIILMLVFGFIMFTHAVRINTVLQVAAREGARDYAKTHNQARAVEKVKDELSMAGIDPSDVDIDISVNGQERRVRVKLPYPVFVPFAGEYGLSLKGDASFHAENDVEWH
jgi:hypothetical protein